MFLDRWQYAISEMEGNTYGENGQGIPVFTFEEVAGLIMGYDPWDIGLQVHQIQQNLCLIKSVFLIIFQRNSKVKTGKNLAGLKLRHILNSIKISFYFCL